MTNKIKRSENAWREQLTLEQFRITRNKGTEAAFTGKYTDCKKIGTYHCVCCGNTLFQSEAKFDSGSGWPSFYNTTHKAAVAKTMDESHGMRRTEVTCNSCEAHLGHVFEDGPAPTGLRYCINSASLTLKEKD